MDLLVKLTYNAHGTSYHHLRVDIYSVAVHNAGTCLGLACEACQEDRTGIPLGTSCQASRRQPLKEKLVPRWRETVMFSTSLVPHPLCLAQPNRREIRLAALLQRSRYMQGSS